MITDEFDLTIKDKCSENELTNNYDWEDILYYIDSGDSPQIKP